MRRTALAFFLLAGGLCAAPVFAYTSLGAPSGYVNDYAHVLSLNAKQSLEQELVSFEASTTNEIAVVTVPDLGGDYIENYSVKLFQDWKIGKQDKDNGVLLLLAIDDHKMRIEVGYGLEGALPDSIAQSILNNELTPRLKAGDYDGAVYAGVHAIEAAVRGEYVAPEGSTRGRFPTGDGVLWAIIVAVFIFQWFVAILARSKSWWAGGIVGALAGFGLGWYLAFAFAFTTVITLMLGALGLLLDYLVSNAYRTHSFRGSTPPWWAGGGGMGSSGGGGFGGFGGGSSGGGGASGSW